MSLKRLFTVLAASTVLASCGGKKEVPDQNVIFERDAVRFFNNEGLTRDSVNTKKIIQSSLLVQEDMLEKNDSTIGAYFLIYSGVEKSDSAHVVYLQDCFNHKSRHQVLTEIGKFGTHPADSLDQRIHKLPKMLKPCPVVPN